MVILYAKHVVVLVGYAVRKRRKNVVVVVSWVNNIDLSSTKIDDVKAMGVVVRDEDGVVLGDHNIFKVYVVEVWIPEDEVEVLDRINGVEVVLEEIAIVYAEI